MNMKYICKSSHANSYKITKSFKVNGKSKSFHYGSFKTLEEAIKKDYCLKFFEENVSEKYKTCREYSEFDDKELARKWSN